jgi:hypothetical protein
MANSSSHLTKFKSIPLIQTSFISLNPVTLSNCKCSRLTSGSTILLEESFNSTKRQRSWVWLQKSFTFPTESFSANTKTKTSWWLLKATATDWSGFTWMAKRKDRKRLLWTNFSFTPAIWKPEKMVRFWLAQLASDVKTRDNRRNQLITENSMRCFQSQQQWTMRNLEGQWWSLPKANTNKMISRCLYGQLFQTSVERQQCW